MATSELDHLDFCFTPDVSVISGPVQADDDELPCMQCNRLADQVVPTASSSPPAATCSVGYLHRLYRRLSVHFNFSPVSMAGSATNEPNRPECVRPSWGRPADARPAVRGQNAALPVHVSGKSTRQARGASWARLTRPPDLHSSVHPYADGSIDVLIFPPTTISRNRSMAPRKKRRTVHARNRPRASEEEHCAALHRSRAQLGLQSSEPPSRLLTAMSHLLSPAGLFSALNT